MKTDYIIDQINNHQDAELIHMLISNNGTIEVKHSMRQQPYWGSDMEVVEVDLLNLHDNRGITLYGERCGAGARYEAREVMFAGNKAYPLQRNTMNVLI
jgi:hypothetical protein